MSTCTKCPAYVPTHTPEGEERRGVCRFDPPRVYRRKVLVKDPKVPDDPGVWVKVYDSAWPPVVDSHWCVRGRVLMEMTGATKPTPLSLGFARQP